MHSAKNRFAPGAFAALAIAPPHATDPSHAVIVTGTAGTSGLAEEQPYEPTMRRGN